MATLMLLTHLASAIRCYQCSTATDLKGPNAKRVDTCGAYTKFNRSQHIALGIYVLVKDSVFINLLITFNFIILECNSDESHMPGSFCMKVVNQSPRGFICKPHC